MRYAFSTILLMTATAQADGLNFDAAKLCAWQHDNNGMDATECLKLEAEGKTEAEGLESKAEKPRIQDCQKEARDFSADSGFASYLVYAACMKNGPGSF